MLTLDYKDTTHMLHHLKSIVCGDVCYLTNKVQTIYISLYLPLNKSGECERGPWLQLEEKPDLELQGILQL